MENTFNVGDRVITTCTVSVRPRRDFYIVPKGSVGTILGPSRDKNGYCECPVHFDTVHNYPNIGDGFTIWGDGHYIPTRYLTVVESE